MGGVATIAGTAFVTGVAVTIWAMLAESEGRVVATTALFVLTFVVAALIAGASLLTVGVPLTWLLSKMRVETWLHYALSGAVTGALAYSLMLFATSPIPLRFLDDQLFETTIGGIAGTIGGTIWWFTARRWTVVKLGS